MSAKPNYSNQTAGRNGHDSDYYLYEAGIGEKNDPKYWYLRGNMLYDQKKYAQAIEQYTLSLKLDDKQADCYFNRGNAYRNQGLYSNAIEDYNAAIRLNPSDAGAYVKKGVALILQGGAKNAKRAIEYYTRAIELLPDCAEAFVKRGNAYYVLEDQEKALLDYSTCILLPRARPKFKAEAHCKRAILYCSQSKAASAVEDLKCAINYCPDTYNC